MDPLDLPSALAMSGFLLSVVFVLGLSCTSVLSADVTEWRQSSLELRG